jgi:hypothetical protein
MVLEAVLELKPMLVLHVIAVAVTVFAILLTLAVLVPAAAEVQSEE